MRPYDRQAPPTSVRRREPRRTGRIRHRTRGTCRPESTLHPSFFSFFALHRSRPGTCRALGHVHRPSVLKAMAAREAGGFAASAVNMPIVLPWTTLLEILVVVPLGAALLAALFTRSRMPLARRAG